MKQINIKEYVNQEMDRLRRTVIDPPSLLIINATDGDVGNQIYIKKKVEDFQYLGWPVEVVKPTNRLELASYFDYSFDCIIVQMPIAEKLNLNVKRLIPRKKDCDGLSIDPLVMPATVRGIIDYLDACEFPYFGKTAVILGRSNIVGKPIAKALLDKDITVCQCHSKTPTEVKYKLLHDSDLVISATGQPGSLWRICCPKAVVIDVGISRGYDNKITGDFVEDREHCEEGAWSTPVPGGVGLLTRLGLIKNCVDLKNKSDVVLKNY